MIHVEAWLFVFPQRSLKYVPGLLILLVNKLCFQLRISAMYDNGMIYEIRQFRNTTKNRWEVYIKGLIYMDAAHILMECINLK